MDSKIRDCDPKTFVYLPLSAKMNETLYLHLQSEKVGSKKKSKKNFLCGKKIKKSDFFVTENRKKNIFLNNRAQTFGTEPRGRHNEGKFAFAWASITFHGTDWGKWANTFGWEPSLDGPITKK